MAYLLKLKGTNCKPFSRCAQLSYLTVLFFITVILLLVQLLNSLEVEKILNNLSGHASNEIQPRTDEQANNMEQREHSIDALEIFQDIHYFHKACRFHGACIDKNGTIFVHDTWKNKEKTVQKECRISQISYINSKRRQSFIGLHTDHSQWHPYTLDLLGIPDMARLQGKNIAHQPHFVHRTLPAYVASNLILDRSNKSKVAYKCQLPNESDCSPKLLSKIQNISLGFVIPDRVWRIRYSESWIPQFLKLLPGQPLFLPSSSLFQAQTRVQCFNSILIFPPKLYRFRPPKWPGISYKLDLFREKSKTHKCNVNIAILDRQALGRRNFLNGRDLIRGIERKLSTITPLHINVNMSVFYFENTSFSAQVQAISRADLIVGAHGAGLTNIIFAKKNTPVMEVFPYLYYYNLFQQFATVFSLSYNYSISMPDTSSFLRCVKAKYDGRRSPNLPSVSQIFWRNVMDRYYKNANPTRKENVPCNCSALDGLKIRHCVRDQSLKINVQHVSDWVLSWVNKTCRESE